MKKKLLLLLFVLSPMIASAQKFYTSSDVEVGWKYWSSQFSWDYLMSNGEKVTLSSLPKIQWTGGSMANPLEICATYLRNNKFLVITVYEQEGIRVCESNSRIPFTTL